MFVVAVKWKMWRAKKFEHNPNCPRNKLTNCNSIQDNDGNNWFINAYAEIVSSSSPFCGKATETTAIKQSKLRVWIRLFRIWSNIASIIVQQHLIWIIFKSRFFQECIIAESLREWFVISMFFVGELFQFKKTAATLYGEWFRVLGLLCWYPSEITSCVWNGCIGMFRWW